MTKSVLLYSLAFAVPGAVFAGATPILLVLLDVPGVSLATGIEALDSMLYSMPGFAGVITVGILWAIGGALGGAVLGCVWGAVSAWAKNPRQTVH